MARAAKKQAKERPALLKALDHCMLAYRENGDEYQTHTLLRGGWAYAFDGVLAAGHRIDDDIDAAVQTKQLRDGLARVGDGFSLASATGALELRQAGFRARLLTIADELLTVVEPSAAEFAVPPSFTEAIALLGRIVRDTERALTSCICVRSNTMLACDSVMALEHWHGVKLPDGQWNIPVAAIKAIAKVGEPIARIGVDLTSMTFWFSRDKWLRTQVYQDKWPDTSHFWLGFKQAKFAPLSDEFYNALHKLEPFANTDRNRVEIRGNVMGTDTARHKIDFTVRRDVRFNMSYLKIIRDIVTGYDFGPFDGTHENKSIFICKDKAIRGVFMHLG